MEAAIDICDLSVRFATRNGPVDALQGLSLTVKQGQVVGFLGPNGAGKTTAMHVLLGFTAPTSGTALIYGRNVGESIARERIGYLPEHPDTYRFLTARELLYMAGRLFLMPRKKLLERIDQVLDRVELTWAADRRIATYSRGMLQRAGLAQALINDPDLVILDEPTGGLDPLGRMSVRKVIASLRDAGKTVFFSSHELSEVELVCDHIAVIAEGRLVDQGPVNKLVGAEESLEKYFLKAIGAE